MVWEILAVDDDAEMRFLLRATLTRKGFEVTEASNGKEAVDRVFISQPDLILMDVMMPIMDGLTACQIIHSAESTSHIPIILLSALVSQEDETKGMDSGARLYLKKPVSPAVLVQVVSEILRNHDV